MAALMRIPHVLRFFLTVAVLLGAAAAHAEEVAAPPEDAVPTEEAAPTEETAPPAREWGPVVSDDPRVAEWVSAWRWEAPADFAASRAADAAMAAMAAEAGAPDASNEARLEACGVLLAVLAEDIPLQPRREAMRLLGLLAPGEVAPEIAAYLEHPDLADDARMALEQMPAIAATDALLQAINLDEPAVKSEVLPAVLLTLGRRGDDTAIETLRAYAAHTDPALKWAAFRALVAMGVLPPQIFAASPDFNAEEAHRYTLGAFIAAAALEKRDSDAPAARVYERLAQAPLPAHYICAILHGLANTGSEQTMQHAIAYLGEPGVHETAESVLIALRAPGTNDRLAEAATHASPVHRAALLRILVEREALERMAAITAAEAEDDPLVRSAAALAKGEVPSAMHLKRAYEAYPGYFARLADWLEAVADTAEAAGDATKAGLLRATLERATTPPVTPLVNGHAHNDYEHPRPLLDALDHGFCSIEADVYAVDGDLLVAHDIENVSPERTLRTLYLDPLLERVRENNGRVYPGGPTIILLVDIKSEAEETYAVLRHMLTDYGEMLTAFTDDGIEERAVRVILSGNRPTETVASEPRRLVAIDGRRPDLDANPPVSLMPMVSMPWHNVARVRRDADEIPADAVERIREFANEAKAQGRISRLWASPEHPEAWDLMLEAGLDLLNIDDLGAFREYMNQRQP